MLLKKILILVCMVPLVTILPSCIQKPQDGKVPVKVPKKERKKQSSKKSKREKKGKKEKENKNTKSTKEKKPFIKLNYEELKEAKNRLVTEGNLETAIHHLEKMISLCSDPIELKENMLEVADLLFDNGELLKAQQLFEKFSELYPGDKDIEYATYKSILCSYWSILEIDRDQSKTKSTITLSEKFLNRSDIFTNYAKEVSEILVDCQYRLFDSESNIFRFYLNQNDCLSAENRLKSMEKEFLPKLPQIEPQLLTLACDLAKQKGDEKTLQQTQATLQKKYPGYTSAMILAYNKQSSFTDKF